jgi:hypothetical protein
MLVRPHPGWTPPKTRRQEHGTDQQGRSRQRGAGPRGNHMPVSSPSRRKIRFQVFRSEFGLVPPQSLAVLREVILLERMYPIGKSMTESIGHGHALEIQYGRRDDLEEESS